MRSRVGRAGASRSAAGRSSVGPVEHRQAAQDPEAVEPFVSGEPESGQARPRRDHRLLPAAFDQLVGDRVQRTARLGCARSPRPSVDVAPATESRSRGRAARPPVPSVDDPPDAAALAVAAGVGQRHLVVADDPVVEVGDVERAVGAELDVHGAEPGVVAARGSRAARSPSGVEPCHSIRSWLIRLVTTLPMKTVPR